MKKTIANLFMASITVAMLSLAACGSSGASSSSTSPTSSQTSDEKSTQAESSETETNSESASAASEETTLGTQDVSFESFTPIDNDECSVTIKDIDPDNMWGYTVKVGLENKSSDKTYMFSVNTASVNGVVADPLFAKEVAPGKKANEDISFNASDLKENGITDFTDIEMEFRVYDTNDWSADDVAKEVFHIYPYGEDKAITFERDSQASDEVLVDNDNVTVILTGKTEDPIWGYTLKLFIVNKTDTEIMVSADEASVNGYMADPFFAKSVPSGKCAFTSMSWSDSTLKENDITTIEEIEFKLRVYDNNNWTGDDFFNEVITVTP